MKRILLGTLAAALLSASAAAQSDPQPTHAEQVQHWAEVGIDTQLKSMKTNLHLSADQDALWGPFEAAVKDGAKARVIALQKEQSDNLSPMDRNLAKADRIAQGQATIETMVDAAKPLYASLDETQKHKFITLGRMLVPERGQFAKAIRRLH
jgi:nitrate/nitrite-specific signal transduction histidine kinase